MSMEMEDVISAWENPEFRDSLPDELKRVLPEHPSGPMQGVSQLDNQRPKTKSIPCSRMYCSFTGC
jgi:mersacidin/lichenicidin family type 2 lantibiotic